MTPTRDLVTGAFSYTGQHVTRRLLALGREVRTLTGHPNRENLFGAAVQAFPYDFDRPERLVETLWGVDTLYNTYWIRFPYGSLTYEQAVANSRTLFQSAQNAGVRRIVHVSIANPSRSSPLAYYAGKALVEEALLATGIPYAIFRPTVIFGEGGILINNIAWMVRHFPIFAVPGDGAYKLQPISVEDLSEALVLAGQRQGNSIEDALGPEAFSFNDLVKRIAQVLGRRIWLVHASPQITYAATALLGRWLGDIVLTREEIRGLLDNLLVSNAPPLGHSRLSEWLKKNAATVGRSYTSEIRQHFEAPR